MNKSKIVLIAGPGGVGKNAIINNFLSRVSGFERLVSYTTRSPRSTEKYGIDYYYITDSEFQEKMKSGEIFEHTERYGYFRGMSKNLIDDILARGNRAIKDADIIGVNALRKAYPKNVVSIFVTADKDIIKERLIARGDNTEDRNRRLDGYDKTMKDSKHFDFVIKNNETIEKAVDKIIEILGVEASK